MVFSQHGDNMDHKSAHSLYLKIIYNFTYRLSGNTDVAQRLTKNVLLKHPAHHNEDVILLKDAWKDFLKNNECLGFKGEDQIQQALLALSPELRCSVILRDILGYSYGQIANVLNKSNSEVGSLISIGRQRITKFSKKTIIIG